MIMKRILWNGVSSSSDVHLIRIHPNDSISSNCNEKPRTACYQMSSVRQVIFWVHSREMALLSEAADFYFLEDSSWLVGGGLGGLKWAESLVKSTSRRHSTSFPYSLLILLLKNTVVVLTFELGVFHCGGILMMYGELFFLWIINITKFI
jgi:hypothetical protein